MCFLPMGVCHEVLFLFDGRLGVEGAFVGISNRRTNSTSLANVTVKSADYQRRHDGDGRAAPQL